MRRTPLLLLALWLSACEKPGANIVKPPEVQEIDEDADGWSSEEGDCDDNNPAVNPGLTEICDGLDDDCDGEIDAGLTSTFYADTDGDGYGSDVTIDACALPAGYAEVPGDCDDDAPEIFPGQPELCDGLDNGCSDGIDEGVTSLFFQDTDGDGYGDPAVSEAACAAPEGFSAASGDCDDNEARAWPSNPEVCDGVDNDCNGVVDEGVLLTFYADTDGDNYGDPDVPWEACATPAGYQSNAEDCDDDAPTISPVGVEVCNGLDDNCDGVTDDDAVDRPTWYADADGDGYGDAAAGLSLCTAPLGYLGDGTDCDDAAPDIHPGADETCAAGDEDCDGLTDDPVLDPATDAPTWYDDTDGDGFGDGVAGTACDAPPGTAAVDGDCDDADPAVSPSGIELCNGLDDDCNGRTDEDAALDAPTWYYDLDGDGYGDPANTDVACEISFGQTTDNTDCNDGQPSANPSEPEICDGIDNNCDGAADEDTSTDALTWYRDDDRDGFGDPSVTTRSCSLPADYAANDLDCDDGWAAAFPGGVEVCDEHDNDCDGDTDEASATDAATWYRDSDNDGYGRTTATVVQCDPPVGYAALPDDCDDSNASAFPGGAEVCDSADNDCDGSTDVGASDALVWYLDGDADGYGNAARFVADCEQPSGYVASATDCSDSNAEAWPGAPERCDLIDQDCDGDLDDPESVDAFTWYTDTDADGYGAPGTDTQACAAPADHVRNDEDCDDTDGSVYPHATETSGDAEDDDCDGNLDCDDLNCDGWPDLVFANSRDDSGYAVNSYIYYGSATGFGAPAAFPTLGALKAEVADIDADGYLDVVFVNSQSSATVYDVSSYIYWGSASGPDGTVTALAASGAKDVSVADLNGDGQLDLVFASYRNNSSLNVSSPVYYNAGGRSFSAATSLPQFGAAACAVGDLDDDGFSDVALTYGASSTADPVGVSHVYWGTATGISTTEVLDIRTFPSFDVLIEDFDEDGDDDLFMLTYNQVNDYFGYSAVQYNNGDRLLDNLSEELLGYSAFRAIAADLDGTGPLDLAIASSRETSSSRIVTDARVFFNTGNDFSNDQNDQISLTGAVSVAAGDLNDDGLADLVYANQASTSSSYEVNSYVYFAYPTDTARYDTSHRTSLPTLGAAGVSVADLDEDGWTDVVFANLRNNSSYAVSSYVYWGSALGFVTSNRTELATLGATGDPVVVGAP